MRTNNGQIVIADGKDNNAFYDCHVDPSLEFPIRSDIDDDYPSGAVAAYVAIAIMMLACVGIGWVARMAWVAL